jgi:preprotein translocase subunit SecA
MISKTLESAQMKIEGFNFDSRKQILAYDDVLNLQRQAVYSRRRKLLMKDVDEVEAVLEEVRLSSEDVGEVITAKQTELGAEVFIDLFRRLALQMTDMLWVEHLEVMSYTRSSVGLRAYGQRDPLIEYRKEGTRLFKEMQEILIHRIADVLPNLQPQVVVKEEAALKRQSEAAQEAAGETVESKTAKNAPLIKSEGFERNEMVTVTNGTETLEMKYKKAEPLLVEGWTILGQK